MSRIEWDKTGERRYETGVDHAVLYLLTGSEYNRAYAWNGITAINESPSGAEASPQYADNIKYLNLISNEEFGGTIEAFTYPDEFGECDGTAEPEIGVSIGQQSRRTFGLSYRTLVGNDIDGSDYGYKIHLVWGALAAPSEKSRATVNDSPEAMTLSWEFTTTPVPVEGFKPTSKLTVDSTRVSAAALKELEDLLYGTNSGGTASLPSPEQVLALFNGSRTEVTPGEVTFVDTTGVVTVPNTTGVVYRRMDTNTPVSGTFTLTEEGTWVTVRAFPLDNTYVIPVGATRDWQVRYAPEI